MYKVDPCYNPQFDPNCPGYEVPMPVIPDIEIYDATQDEYVNLNDDEKKTSKSPCCKMTVFKLKNSLWGCFGSRRPF